MLDTTQAKISELVAEIERLTPLAEAERLAELASIENLWLGSTRALHAAEKERDRLVDERKAKLFAERVGMIQNELERRIPLAERTRELEAKIAEFSQEDRDYFKAANEIMRWVGPQFAGPSGRHSAMRYDARGHLLDASPLNNGQPVVPDDHWEAVKQIRALHKELAGLGSALSTIDSGVRQTIQQNPAFALVKPRELAPTPA